MSDYNRITDNDGSRGRVVHALRARGWMEENTIAPTGEGDPE